MFSWCVVIKTHYHIQYRCRSANVGSAREGSTGAGSTGVESTGVGADAGANVGSFDGLRDFGFDLILRLILNFVVDFGHQLVMGHLLDGMLELV